MRLINIGSFLLILLVALATSETVEKPTDASVDASENNTEIPGVTEIVSQVSSTTTTENIPKILIEEVKGPRSRSETNGETEEVVKLEREALLEKRSIGNIARLLLGGNVPPNHPLVKNPEPKTFNLASNIVASVPGREYGGSGGWNTGWNSNNALSQLSALLSTKQRLIPHLSQVTSGVTGLAGVKGELFKQIQTISTAAIAQAAADAAAKAVAASAAAQAVTNTVANAVHQTPTAVEDALKYTNNNLLQGWYSNQQNTYASLPAATAAATQTNNIVTPFSQQSQIVNQYRQATVQQPQSNYHPSYAQYQQQQQQQPQQAPNNLYSNQPNNQPNFNNNYNAPASNNYNAPASNNYNAPALNNNNAPALNNFNNNYNAPQSNNFNSPAPNFNNNFPTPLIAAPSNLNQASNSAGVPGNANAQSNYNSQAVPPPFNSAGNSFGATAHTNNAPQYSPASPTNSYNSGQQFPPAQNYGGYNSNTNAFNSGNGNSNNNNYNNNNYNRNAAVGGAGPSAGYASGQHSQPAGSHAYPPNGQGYSGPPPGNFNSASGIPGGYPNAHYNPSTSASGNQYSGNGNGPQNYHNPGPPYNSPSTNFNQGPPAPFNAPPPSNSYSAGPSQNFGPQGPPNGFGGYGNSHINRPFNYDASASNTNNNYNVNNNNNYNRNNDNRFNNNDNNNNNNNNNHNNFNGNRPLYDSPNNNNNNNFNRNTYDNRNNNINSNNNAFQGHSRFHNKAARPSSAPGQGSRKGVEPSRYYTKLDEEDLDADDLVDKREWSSNSHKHENEKDSDVLPFSSPFDSAREDRHRRVKPVYKESYNPHKHRWTEHPPRRGQVDDRPNFPAHKKSKLGASRRAHHGQRSKGRKPEQPREVYTTLPEYVFRNDRPHRSANQSALLIPVSLDEDVSLNVSPNSELATDLSSSSGTATSSPSSSSLPATLTINLPSAEEHRIFPSITVFETSFVS